MCDFLALQTCFDGRAAHLLPEILPESVQGLPVVYWDGEDIYCPECANSPAIRPLVLALDVTDVLDVCFECGSICGGDL